MELNIFTLITLDMLLIIILMRRHLPLGLCMLGGGLFIWGLQSGDPQLLFGSLVKTLQQKRTFDLIAALYLVMCLEIELRTSGTLAGMVAALRRAFSSAKVTLMVMPAFLGLLPSLGGARFSAPIVREASKDLGLDPHTQSAINFWFRHPFEFSNPIIPGMIMACSIAEVPYSDFVQHTAWMSVVAFIAGWFFLIRPIKELPALAEDTGEQGGPLDIALSLAPVILTFLLVVFAGLTASLAMAVTVAVLFVVLHLIGRPVSPKQVIIGAIDRKMLLNISCILYFINILNDTRVLTALCDAFRAAPLPIPVIIAAISFIIGVLTGMSQAHVAIVMPIVAAMQTGSLTLAAVAMIFGVAGQMLTPTHMCLVVTLDYFHADIFRTLKPVLWCEIVMLTIFSLVTWVRG